MTFEEEWAELKHENSVRMNLAGAGGEDWSSGGGQGDLRSSRQAWSQGSQAVGSVHVNLKAALRDLETKQDGIVSGSSGVDGLRSVASQLSVYQSWQQRLDLVSRECEELKDKLQKSGDAFYKTDEAIKEAFQEQKTTPRNGARIDSSPKGRGES
ncbi:MULTISPECIES: hypothetical protein [Streptomyces]|uniref:hypothetical protein n=1 Tax=Streptomyces TaxID=1883 RepID=UPI000C278CC7|nr:hypothetical protein [Streptomyces sp. CB02959]PJN38318.1 hypothetical protein CG747_23915 [Streptomyces sp. CB02959]